MFDLARCDCPAMVLAASLDRSNGTNQEGGERVLALTDSAVEAVKTLVESTDDTESTSGLRMVAEPEGPQTSLQLSIAAVPAEDDEVIEEQGARVFLEPHAAALLGDKILDASIEQGQVEFTLAEQIEE
jgi:iron-sulfur cluster assembly protein